MISLYSKCRYLLIAQRLYVLLFILPALVSCQQPYCDESLGVCPPPETGTFVNSIGLTKSVYFKDEWLSERSGYNSCAFNLQTLCIGDLDRSPGDELILKAPRGVLIITSHPTNPIVIAQLAVPDLEEFEFLDVDGDGNSEFFFRATSFVDVDYDEGVELHFYNHSGELGWHAQGLYRWTSWDLDADGIVEFILGSARGVRILSPAGEVLGEFGDGPFCGLELVDTDGIEPLELVTSDFEGNLIVWRVDGTVIFEINDRHECFLGVVRDPQEDGHHLIWSGGDQFIMDGNHLESRSDIDTMAASFYDDFVHLQAAMIPSTCQACWPESDPVTSAKVRFLANAEPFSVEFDYSIMTTQPFVAGFPMFEPTRTIVSIFDSANVLVYHEVFSASSGPGSFAVIPSDVEGQEILLVADGTDILAYKAAP